MFFAFIRSPVIFRIIHKIIHTITDKKTKLIWQKCSNGQYNDTRCSGESKFYEWEEAYNLCGSLKLAGKKWRIPTVAELTTLIIAGYQNPSIDRIAFPNTRSSYYWTSTIYNSNVFVLWYVDFDNGYVAYKDKQYSENRLFLRCVSGEWYSD